MLNRLSNRVLHRKLSDHSVDVGSLSQSQHCSSPNTPLLKPKGSLRTGVGSEGSPKIDVTCTVGDKCSCGPPRVEGGGPGFNPRHTDSPRRRRAGEIQLRLDEELERRNSCGNATNEYTKRAGNNGGSILNSDGSSLDDIKKTTSAGEVGLALSSNMDSNRNGTYDSPQKKDKMPMKSFSKSGETFDSMRPGKSDVQSTGLMSGKMFGEGKKRSGGCSDYTPLNFDVNYVKVSPPKMTRRPKRESPPKNSDGEDGQLLMEGFSREMMIRLGRSPQYHPTPEEKAEVEETVDRAKDSVEKEFNAKKPTSCSSENSCDGISMASSTLSKDLAGDNVGNSPTFGSLNSSSSLSESDDRPRSGSASDYLCWDDVKAQLTNEISGGAGKPGFDLSGCDPQRLISLINSADMNDEKLNDSITLVKDGDSSLLQFVFTLRLDKDTLKSAVSRATPSETGGAQKVIDTGLDAVDGCAPKVTGRLSIVKEDGVPQIGSVKLMKPLNDFDFEPVVKNSTSSEKAKATAPTGSGIITKDSGSKSGMLDKKDNPELLISLNVVDRNVSKFDSRRLEALSDVKVDSRKPLEHQNLREKLQNSETNQIKNIYSPTRKKNAGQGLSSFSNESKETLTGKPQSIIIGSSTLTSDAFQSRKEENSWKNNDDIPVPPKNKDKAAQSPDSVGYIPPIASSSTATRSRDIICNDIRPVRDEEPEMTHMSWDEVMKEARSLGIPLNRGGGGSSSTATLSRKPGRVLREEVKLDDSVECQRRCSVISCQDHPWSPVHDEIKVDTKMNSSWACPSCLTGMPTPADLTVPEQDKHIDIDLPNTTNRRWGSPLKEKIQNFFCRRSKHSDDSRTAKGSSVLIQDQQQQQLIKQQHRQQAAKQVEQKVTWCTTIPCRQAHRTSSCRPADRQTCSTISSPRNPGCSIMSSRTNKVTTSSPNHNRSSKVTTCSPQHRCQTSCHRCSCETIVTSPKRSCNKACRECSTSPKHQSGGRCNTANWTSPRSRGMTTSQGDLCKDCVHQRNPCDQGQLSPMSPTRRHAENQGCVVLDMTSPHKTEPRSRARGPARSSTCVGSKMRSQTPDMDWVDSRTQSSNPGGSLSPRKHNSMCHTGISTRTGTHTSSGTGTLADSTLDIGTEASSNVNFLKSLQELQECPWYWGSAGFDEAEDTLDGREDGSFLVRDSSDPRYILSLSFRSLGSTHHTRIEHYKGNFSFYAQQNTHEASTIVEFIEGAMRQSIEGKCLYYLRPRAPGLNPAPVLLLYPIHRE